MAELQYVNQNYAPLTLSKCFAACYLNVSYI